jgi:hypothetical protein
MRIMATNPVTHSNRDVLDAVAAALFGGGIVTLALFPLALPALALIAVAAIPLLLIGLVGALLAGLVILPVRLVRRSLAARSRGLERTPVATPTGIAPPWQLREREQAR